MPNKVCPRCGAQYATLKSATCPQCFAKLIEVDDKTAAEMAAKQSALESSPEYQEAKAEEDERFRHQSFQACLLAVGMGVVLVILGIVIIVAARRDHAHFVAKYAHAPIAAPIAAQAHAGDVMPVQVGDFHREKVDQPTALSGTLSLIYHATYVQAGGGAVIDVYAIADDRPAAELARFRDVTQLAAMVGTGSHPMSEVTAKPFLYEIVGAPGPTSANDDFRRAWTSQVGGK